MVLFDLIRFFRKACIEQGYDARVIEVIFSANVHEDELELVNGVGWADAEKVMLFQ